MKKVLIFLILISLLINSSSAAILTSDATPNKTFKCGTSTISATFSDGGIVSVNAYLNSTQAVQPMVPGSGRITPETQSTTVPMAFNGTYWVGTFGNDNTILWGTRGITYGVNTGATTYYTSSTGVFVYGGQCTGTNIQYYNQTNPGIGNYTNMIWNGTGNMNLIEIGIYPFVQYWGFLFYLLTILTVCVSIFMKTENVYNSLLSAFIMFAVLSTTSYINPIYIQWIYLFMAIALAIILLKLFTKR